METVHKVTILSLFVSSVGSSALTEECSVPDAMVGLSEYITSLTKYSPHPCIKFKLTHTFLCFSLKSSVEEVNK